MLELWDFFFQSRKAQVTRPRWYNLALRIFCPSSFSLDPLQSTQEEEPQYVRLSENLRLTFYFYCEVWRKALLVTRLLISAC